MLVDRFMLLLKFTAQFTYNLQRLMILFLNVNEFLTASLFLFGKEIFPTKKQWILPNAMLNASQLSFLGD